MELLDILDKDGQKTCDFKIRETVHLFGYWHKAVHVWIINSYHQVLLQKRASWVRTNPGKWDVSVSGHLEKGEDSIQAVIREAKEEINIELEPAELKFLFSIKRRSIKNNNSYINNEFNDIFLVKKDVDDIDLKNKGEEVDELKWFSLKDFREFCQEKNPNIVHYDEEYKKMLDYLK